MIPRPSLSAGIEFGDAMTEPLIESDLVDELKSLAEGDEAFLSGLLNQFMASCRLDLALLEKQGPSPVNPEETKRILHSIQGRSANIGLKKMAGTCKSMGSGSTAVSVATLEAVLAESMHAWCATCGVKAFK